MNVAGSRRGWYERGYGLDLRSLGIARIGVGGLMLADALDRIRYARAFTSDVGVLPLPALEAIADSPWPVSPYLLTGEPWWQLALLSITAAAAIALMAGYRTWLATILCWFLIVSVQVRTPHIAYSFDDELAGVLFWSMFIPWGSRFSFDAKTRGSSRARERFTGIGSTGLVLHIAFMYVLTGLLKIGPAWQSNLAAIYQAVSLESFRGVLAPILLAHPEATKVLTFLVPKLEVAGGVLLLVPVRYVWVRIAGLVGLASLSVGFATMMRLGLFPYMNLVALIPFVPGRIWECMGSGAARGTTAGNHVSRSLDGSTRGLRGPPRVAQAIAAIPLIVLIGWTMTRIVRLPAPMASIVTETARAMQLDPFWYLFAPGPRADDVWVIGEGTRADGSQVDVLREGQPIDPRTLDAGAGEIRKPRPRFARPDSFRWIKYRDALTSVYAESAAPLAYATYLCHEWNERHPQRPVVEVKLRVAGEDILPTFERRPRESELLARVVCE